MNRLEMRAWVDARWLVRRMRLGLKRLLRAFSTSLPKPVRRPVRHDWPVVDTRVRDGRVEVACIEPVPPKSPEASTLLADSASELDREQLDELGARVTANIPKRPVGFPIASYQQAVARWKVPPSARWLHHVRIDQRPSELFLRASQDLEPLKDEHAPAAEASANAHPAEVLVYGRNRDGVNPRMNHRQKRPLEQ